MNLTLARAIACSAEGCRVQLLTDSSMTDAPLAPLMRQIGTRVRPGHIVALDRSVSPPEIRWRFGRDKVEALVGDRATLRGQQFRLTDARPDDERAIPIRIGDTVLVRRGGAADELTVFDLVEDGCPLHPERSEADFPQIEATYRGSARARPITTVRETSRRTGRGLSALC